MKKNKIVRIIIVTIIIIWYHPNQPDLFQRFRHIYTKLVRIVIIN